MENITKLSSSVYKAIIEQTVEAISLADMDGKYLFVNPAFCELMGYGETELLQKTVFDMKASEQNGSHFHHNKNKDTAYRLEVILQKKDGTTFIAEVIGKKIVLESKELVLGFVKDISEQIHIQDTLKKSQEQISMAMQVANDGIWDWNMKANTVEFDERYYTMAGYENKAFDYSFDEWQKRVHKDDIANAFEKFEAYLDKKTDKYEVDFRFLRAEGYYMWIRAKGKIVAYDEDGKPERFVGTHSDINKEKEDEDKIKFQAHYDTLTRLPNRFLTLDRLKIKCIKSAHNATMVALLFIDLDDFKKINDTLGHEFGDEILVETAQRLINSVRRSDTVGRLGGDEFVIILDDIKHNEVILNIVQNVLSSFITPFEIDNRKFSLGASIGIACYPQDGQTPSTLLKHADTAMYSAKDNGKNNYQFYKKEMNNIIQKRFIIEEQLRSALKNGEFKVFYQPKIDIKNSTVVGAEALLRWSNPTLGDVSPVDFIPIAEQTGIIIEIGKFVLKEALKQTALWRSTFSSHFQIAINLSPAQFRDERLLEDIKLNINANNLPMGSLELEITEGVLLNSHCKTNQILQSISKEGINLAMDDFGTGYSSLSYLKNYPFNTLKIDKSFIDNITENISDKELVNASLAMAKALNLRVVAEGVELVEQLHVLRTLECDLVQGFLFDKALCAEEFTKLLQKETPYKM